MNNPYINEAGEKLTMQEKKAVLKQYSALAKNKIQSSGIDLRVNEVLEIIYEDMTGAKEWHTYQGWIEKGYKVKTGEKAFCVWTKPRKVEKEIDEATNEEYEFFGVAHIFGNHQVEAINDIPEYGKQYSLAEKSKGKTWAESEVHTN